MRELPEPIRRAISSDGGPPVVSRRPPAGLASAVAMVACLGACGGTTVVRVTLAPDPNPNATYTCRPGDGPEDPLRCESSTGRHRGGVEVSVADAAREHCLEGSVAEVWVEVDGDELVEVELQCGVPAPEDDVLPPDAAAPDPDLS